MKGVISEELTDKIRDYLTVYWPGCIAQSVACLTQEPEVPGSTPSPATYFCFSFRSFKEAVVSYWPKYVHEVLVNCLEGLSLPVRLTDRPNMTIAVYCGCETTT